VSGVWLLVLLIQGGRSISVVEIKPGDGYHATTVNAQAECNRALEQIKKEVSNRNIYIDGFCVRAY
jgi:hypothetical protein